MFFDLFLKRYLFFFYFFYKLKKKIRLIFNIDQIITLGVLKVNLPPDHNLSLYNNLYPEYDKFISKVVVNLPENSSVLDIGANVGDTVGRLIQSNNKLNYYCIEADNFFFDYLNLNVKNFKKIISCKITLIKLLVGLDLQGELIGKHGTKSLLESKNSSNSKIIKSKKIDKIISEYNINEKLFSDCSLFKYPSRNKIKTKTFLKTESPLVFSNRIAYTLGQTDSLIKFENEFYVTEISNLPESEMINIKYDEYCGQESRIPTYYLKNVSPDKFYIKYNKGNDTWKH